MTVHHVGTTRGDKVSLLQLFTLSFPLVRNISSILHLNLISRFLTAIDFDCWAQFAYIYH